MNTIFPTEEAEQPGHCNFYIIDDLHCANPDYDVFFKNQRKENFWDEDDSGPESLDSEDDTQESAAKRPKVEKDEWKNLTTKERRKKAVHLYRKLRNLLPTTNKGYCDGSFIRMSILYDACEFIQEVNQKKISLEECRKDKERLESEIAQLKAENESLKKEVFDLKYSYKGYDSNDDTGNVEDEDGNRTSSNSLLLSALTKYRSQ